MLLAGISYLSVIIYQNEIEVRAMKEDLVELSKVKYGIFSADEWKRIIEEVLAKKINEFNFNELPKAEIRRRIEKMLYKITGDLQSSFKEEKGFLPRAVANITGIFGKMEKDVPKITNTIMTFIEDPDNREAVRVFALNKLDNLTDKTFSEMDYTMYDAVLERHGCLPRDEVVANLTSGIDTKYENIKPAKFLLFLLAAFAAVILIFGRNLTRHEFFFLILITLCFLATGLLLPMIEIDARISEMRFSLLGEVVEFKDQILYYKNKSILEVVQVMIVEERFDLMVVGFLVLLFSVLFPLSKLISSVFYVYWQKLRQNKVLKFLIFRTGKWSMADVMVLAIFMSFIGFSGIIREQLKQIEIDSPNLDVLTTNFSTLQVGFFTFMCFAVLGLLVSHKLQYAFKEAKKDVLEDQIENVEEQQVKEEIRETKKSARAK